MRRATPSNTEAELLQLSRRRCCLCFGLLGYLGLKKGQIAHLDRDASNNAIENLAFLCLDHHDEYDSRTSQSKGLTLKEVIAHRQALYEVVRLYLDRPEESLLTDVESPMASKGELEYHLAHTASAREEALRIVARVHAGNLAFIAAFESAHTAARREIATGQVTQVGLNRYHARLALSMSELARTLNRDTEALALSTAQMFDSFSRASAVASDLEVAEAFVFEVKIAELDGLRTTLRTTKGSALKCADATRDFKRGSASLNKSRRLVIASLNAFSDTIDRQLEVADQHEQYLRETIALL
jgi:hypothetical protein